jgi:enolase
MASEVSKTSDMKIQKLVAREILDSRGNPTIEVDVFTDCSMGRAAIPSGASTGTHEAIELRDGDVLRYSGKGVRNVIRNITNIIAPKITGIDARNQEEIDKCMIDLDGTANKALLGANAILGVSLATAKAASNGLNLQLFQYLGDANCRIMPVPMMNVLNGGKHAGNDLSIQEFLIIPVGTNKFSEAVRIGAEVYHCLRKVLTERFGKGAVNVGDEGGFAPPLKKVVDALDALSEAIQVAGYSIGEDLVLALDAAASEFYNKEKKTYLIDGQNLSQERLIDYYCELVERYSIKSIEDPLQEEDFVGLADITKKIGRKTQIVGDDIFVTNERRMKKGMRQGAANAFLLKLNQIGTLTESRIAADLCIKNNYNVVVSHRSGETEDTTIADLSVALGTGQIKTGAPARSERTAKYNRLFRIEEILGDSSEYPGIQVFMKH